MRSVLVVIFVVAVFCVVYIQITEPARKESTRLYGRWQVYLQGGHPLVADDGNPVVIELDYNSFTVYPNRHPPSLDFHTKNGTTHAIYRWEGDSLRVTESSLGLERPTQFDPRAGNVRSKRGAKPGQASVTAYFLQRISGQ